MAITRSQIARQLLAEGGAPRIPFRNGGGRTDANTMSGSGYGAGSSSSDDGFGGGDDVARPTYSQQLTNIQNAESTGATFPGLSKVTPRNVFGVSADNPMLQRSLFERAMLQMTPFGGAINLGEMNAFNLPMFRYSNTGGTNNRFNNEDDGDNDNQIVKPMIPKLPTDIEPEKSDYDEFVQRFTLPERFRLAEGGEPRQAYGLGKLVKKVTGAVKKVVKSPIGKAALAGTAIYGLGGGTFGRFGTLPGIGTTGGFKFGNIPLNLFGQSVAGGAVPGTQFEGLLSKIGLSGGYGGGLTFPGGKVGAGIAGLSAAAYALTPKQEEEVDSLSSRIADNTGIDVAQIRKEVQEAYASGNTEKLKTKYPFLITESAAAADGGRIGFDEGGGTMMASNIENDKILEDLFEKYLDMGLSPKDAAEAARQEFDRMSKKQDTDRTMAAGGGMMNPNDEMLNMGGNEMDLRGGGFVPIGEYEKKDDVPARLSKNEFVFTADAVRAAGGGSVDRGADLMYKTMKQLENKVV
jgi:hypothetical protein